MDPDSIERFALNVLAVKFLFFAGFVIVWLYQSGHLGRLCLEVGLTFLVYFLREENAR